MVATVTVYEANGGTDGTPGSKNLVEGQAVNAGTDVRFATTDAYNPVATHPCIIPSSGDNYSYWKHLYFNIATGSGFTTINNIKFYTDGSIDWTCGTGGGLYVGTRTTGDNGVPMDASYEVATGVEGTTGDNMLTAHARCGSGGSAALASNYTSGSPLLIDSTDYSSADDSNAVLLQVKIHSDATQGTQADESLSLVYDEI